MPLLHEVCGWAVGGIAAVVGGAASRVLAFWAGWSGRARAPRARGGVGPLFDAGPLAAAARAYGVMRSIMRAKGIVSRTWCSPHTQETVRSTPRPKPAWGAVP